MSSAPEGRDAKPESPEAEASRSTARPPPAGEDELDLAASLRAARSGAGREAPAAATAKIRPFQLAAALARLSADADSPPHAAPDATRATKPEPEGSSVPTPAVDISREDLLAARATLPTLPPPSVSSPPDAPSTDDAVARHVELPALGPLAKALPTADDHTSRALVATRERRPFSPLVLLPLALGAAALVYAYLVANT
ncbi:MAG: hypothetical protein KF795_19695 [Labilithrix sp.]|nr:hypothetical protein [Labilithrix sp.]